MDLFQWLKDLGIHPPDARPPQTRHTPPIRRRYCFSGLVQGVGFRWEAKMLAGRLGLTGWARNESDGTVVRYGGKKTGQTAFNGCEYRF